MLKSRYRKPGARGAAFTLIELLVVIAIISLLAAILFPVFARARENARRSSCLSNVRQIGLGIAQYTQDFDERIPHNDGAANGGRWGRRVYPYVKNANVFVCPSSGDVTPFFTNTASGGGSSYAINSNLTGFGTQGRSLAEMGDASGTALVAETSVLSKNSNALYSSPDNLDATKWLDYATVASDYQFRPPGCFAASYTASACNSGNVYYTQNDGVSGNNNRRPVPRHFDGLNVVYADGHAKWTRIDAFLGPLPKGWDYGDPRNSWDNR